MQQQYCACRAVMDRCGSASAPGRLVLVLSLTRMATLVPDRSASEEPDCGSWLYNKISLNHDSGHQDKNQPTTSQCFTSRQPIAILQQEQ
jgi:hypothetical protein